MNSKSILNKILNFPLTKIIVGLVIVSFVVAMVQIYFGKFFNYFVPNKEFSDLFVALFSGLAAIASYYSLYHFYENKRAISELSTNHIGKELLTGFIIGFAILSAVVGFIYFFANYKIIGINSLWLLIPSITMSLSSGIIEEILFRGIIFRLLEEKLGSYLAIAISGLLFGFAHISNPNSSLFAALAIAIEAGIMLSLAYIITRSLWFPIAIHFAWNFTQQAIYGANVSGNISQDTFITSQISGNPLITGGKFGPEASIQAIFIGLLTAYLFWRISLKKNQIVAPFWKKKG